MHSTVSLRSLIPLALVCLLLAGAAVQADDFNPPSWRGQPGSTYQMWTFDDPTTVFWGAPQISNNPYGAPLILSSYAYTDGSGYIEASALDIFVPNRQSDDPFKLIRLQLTFVWSDPANVPLVNGWIETNPASQGGVIDAGYVDPTQTPGLFKGWVDFLLTPNPYEETIRLVSSDGSALKWDQIVIDTWCTSTPTIPEPMFLQLGALLGLGGLGLLRQRRRGS